MNIITFGKININQSTNQRQINIMVDGVISGVCSELSWPAKTAKERAAFPIGYCTKWRAGLFDTSPSARRCDATGRVTFLGASNSAAIKATVKRYIKFNQQAPALIKHGQGSVIAACQSARLTLKPEHLCAARND